MPDRRCVGEGIRPTPTGGHPDSISPAVSAMQENPQAAESLPTQQQEHEPQQAPGSGLGSASALERLREWEKARSADLGTATEQPE